MDLSADKLSATVKIADMPENRTLQIELPPPTHRGKVSVEEAIIRRRSVRYYKPEVISLSQLSQVLWAAYGITSPDEGFRAIPSAGATYPLEVFVCVGKNGVEQMGEGIYHYHPERHSLSLRQQGDFRKPLAEAALRQRFLLQAPVDIVICALYQRTCWHYGQRGERYVHMEVGHAGQNIHLQAEALGLATVAVGAFDDDAVSRVLGLEENLRPLYILPLGKAAKRDI